MIDDMISMQSVDKKVISRIYGHGRGWVFTPDDFKDLGSRNAVASALKRYVQKGTIRRLARGVYDYPATDPELGVMEPTVDAIVLAVSRRDAIQFQPSGAYAANLLGLSAQVPTTIVYLTDGRTQKLSVHGRTIELRNAAPQTMITAGTVTGLVIQALRHVGRENVDDRVISQLDVKLNADDRRKLKRDIRHAPEWIAEIIRDLEDREGRD
jgi:predicted transcriptional regulator of viral defense system